MENSGQNFLDIEKHFTNQNFRHRGGSRTAAISKVQPFVILVNGFQPLTIITKSSTLDVAAVLDPPLKQTSFGLGQLQLLEILSAFGTEDNLETICMTNIPYFFNEKCSVTIFGA